MRAPNLTLSFELDNFNYNDLLDGCASNEPTLNVPSLNQLGSWRKSDPMYEVTILVPAQRHPAPTTGFVDSALVLGEPAPVITAPMAVSSLIADVPTIGFVDDAAVFGEPAPAIMAPMAVSSLVAPEMPYPEPRAFVDLRGAFASRAPEDETEAGAADETEAATEDETPPEETVDATEDGTLPEDETEGAEAGLEADASSDSTAAGADADASSDSTTVAADATAAADATPAADAPEAASATAAPEAAAGGDTADAASEAEADASGDSATVGADAEVSSDSTTVAVDATATADATAAPEAAAGDGTADAAAEAGEDASSNSTTAAPEADAGNDTVTVAPAVPDESTPAPAVDDGDLCGRDILAGLVEGVVNIIIGPGGAGIEVTLKQGETRRLLDSAELGYTTLVEVQITNTSFAAAREIEKAAENNFPLMTEALENATLLSAVIEDVSLQACDVKSDDSNTVAKIAAM